MKTKLALLAALLLVLASCGSDDESSATVYYKGMCSSITFENPAHEVYREKIEAALQGLQLTGEMSYFAQSASASTVAEAAAQCDNDAQTTYRARLDKLTLLSLKQTVYRMYEAEFKAAGIMSFADLPFSNLTITFKLLNSQSAMVVKEYVMTLE